MDKDKEVMDWLEERIFAPALAINDSRLNKIINLTKVRLNKLPANKKVHYFWSAIKERADISDYFKKNSATSFEDVYDEFRRTFDDEWLRK